MFNKEVETKKLINFIREYYKKNNLGGCVLGISGGKDSAVVAAIMCDAIGRENVLGVTLPCHSNEEDKKDAKLVADTFGFELINLDLTDTYDVFTKEIKKLGNFTSDELKNSEINSIVIELLSFAKNVEKVFTTQDPVIYSLRYIPWKFYVNTTIATAYQVNYEGIDDLFYELRRFYYLSWISGKTLNGIKQTSFNIIEAVGNKSSLDDIKTIIKCTGLTKEEIEKL